MKIIPIRTMDEALAIALVRPIIEPVKSEGRGRRGKDLGSGKIATKTKRRAAHA